MNGMVLVLEVVEKQKEENLDEQKEGNLDGLKEGKILYYLVIKII
jgi:hypothetical protein